MEIWQKVPGFSRYAASSLGRIADLRTREEMIFNVKREKNYVRFAGRNLIGDDGSTRFLRPYDIVMLAFVGPKGPAGSDTEMIRHLNGNALDCRLENLKYGTKKENSEDTVLHGRANAPRTTLTEKQKIAAIVCDRKGYGRTRIHEELNVSPATSRRILQQFEKEYTQLKDTQIQNIPLVFTDYGLSAKEIADKLHVSERTVKVILFEAGLKNADKGKNM